ncbi:MAG: hypothetical protein QY332_14665 [Anaerolineales bacterium]|nr:MAG: hypothetical protein QY332_14665 [Anaerolineales bacterium]
MNQLISIVDQLDDEARRDVLDVAVFYVWKQTREPAPWRSVIRGARLVLAFEIERRIQLIRVKP